jgi:hypothetical protein
MATAAQSGGRSQTDDGVHTNGDRGENVREQQSRGRTSALRERDGLQEAHTNTAGCAGAME